MPNLHDSGYKLLFSNRTIFRQLLETFVDQPWIARLDFSRAETVDKSFVSDHYKETESDLIYRLPLAHDTDEQELYIYVLLEFQSTVDPWMALRLLNYVTNFYMDWTAGHPGARKAPPVFPILLYNGDARWTAAQAMSELVESTLDLGEYGIGFRYFKIAENEYSIEQLLGIQNIVSTLFLAEARYDVEQLAEELLALFERAEDKRAVSLFLNWFRQLAEHGRIGQEDYDMLATVYRSREEVQSMLVTKLEQWKERLYLEGREEGWIKGLDEGWIKGLDEGREEGREETHEKVVRAMFARGFEREVIAEITGLEIEEIEKIIADRSEDADNE